MPARRNISADSLNYRKALRLVTNRTSECHSPAQGWLLIVPPHSRKSAYWVAGTAIVVLSVKLSLRLRSVLADARDASQTSSVMKAISW